MRILKNNEYKIFESLVMSNQKRLKQTMEKYLSKHYDNVVATKDYVYAIGDIPIALVAHLDTVFTKPVQNLYYDQSKGVLWSPEGLGADDRAGIFAILMIIKSGLRPSIIFTTDEEKGGCGASALSEQVCPFPNLKYMIELDRQGHDDCVFYDCNNREFIEYISNFGFRESWGTFSDISYLAPAWDVCATNLSVGYYDEHSKQEILFVDALFNTINKVKRMLMEEDIPDFIWTERFKSYLPHNPYYGYSDYPSDFEPVSMQKCHRCGDMAWDYELMPVKMLDGSTKFFCPDCYSNCDNVDWCSICYEPYEIPKDKDLEGICLDCLKKIMN